MRKGSTNNEEEMQNAVYLLWLQLAKKEELNLK